MRGKLVLLSIVTVILQLTVSAEAACPWEMSGLVNWDDPAAWDGDLPAENAEVVIKAGKKVVLNVSPPRLTSIVVEHGAIFVWGDVDGLAVETTYIMVHGEFHLGSEDCPFTKKADVILYGKSNEIPHVEGFGGKFVAVDSGGVYQVHGQPKTSWTQLTATIQSSKPGDCGMIYDGDATAFYDERAQGLHLTVWNKDGSVFDKALFALMKAGKVNLELARFKKYIADLPDETIVAIAVSDTIGTPQNTSQNWEELYTAVESLGGTLIREVKSFEPYAFVGVVGDPSLVKEEYTGLASGPIEASAILVLGDYAYTVKSAINPDSQTFRIVHKDLAYPKLNLFHDVSSWNVGDKIFVASTDYDWQQTEVKTIVECDDCSAYQIRVDGEFSYTHFGEVTYGIDQRAEVGILTHNIKFQGVLEDECYHNTPEEADLCEKFGRDTYGGHTKILKGAIAHIEGIELYHMGQQGVLGSYPLHCHLCENATGLYFRNNTIHDSNSRCITIHGTEHLLVSNNVCYKHLGHGFFLEDSAEQNNTIHRNLGIGSQYGTLLFSDRRADWCPYSMMCDILSTFWITHPNNIITDNVAAGGDGHGIVFSFSDVPLGPSLDMMTRRGLFFNQSTRYIPVKKFTGNTMHSNHNSGLWFENMIAYDMQFNGKHYPENAKYSISHYSARDPPNENGERVKVTFSDMTFYKNERFNAWVRCGSIIITNSSFSDSQQGLVTPHIDDGSDCQVKNSIFYGETENKGHGYKWRFSGGEFAKLPSTERPTHFFNKSAARNQADYTISGLSMYQGPSYLENCFFDNFHNEFFNDSFEETWGFRPVRPAAGISFHRSNHYTLKPRTGIYNVSFGYCDADNNQNFVIHGNSSSQQWIIRDGSLSANFRDYDGSVTGVPNTQIVRNRPFFTGPECLYKPEWDSAICPYTYFRLSVTGNNGVLGNPTNQEWPVDIYRDEVPEDVIKLQGERGIHFVLRTYQSYTLKLNSSLAGTPSWIRIRAEWGLSDGEVVRLAVCIPKTTQSLRIEGRNPQIDFRNPPTFVDSLEQLDAATNLTTFFFDSNSGYVYFKMASTLSFETKEQRCPQEVCPEVTIKPQDTAGELAECTDPVIPYKSSVAPPAKVVQPECKGIGSPQGLGAPVEEEPVPAEVKNIPCVAPPALTRSRPVEMRGCFQQSSRNPDFPDDYVYLYNSMTPQVCADRCFQRGFPYAAVNYGSYCRCSHSFGKNGALDISKCSRPCTGDNSLKCGGDSGAYLVYTTGAALRPAPERCGPGNKGWLFSDQKTCVFLSQVEEEYPDAMRTCFKLGGYLGKVQSQEKQAFLEKYLLGLKNDVWIGYTFSDGEWLHIDGTPMDNYTNWREGQGSSGKKRNTRLKSQYDWQWEEYGDWDNNMALCDIPATGPEDLEHCGLDNRGWRRGSTGPCFALINTEIKFEQAQFSCRILGGQVAQAKTHNENYYVLRFLGEFGDRLNYWVDGNPASSENANAYVYNKPHELGEMKQTSEINALCQLDDVKDIVDCPKGWTVGSEGCYLHSGVGVNNFERVAGYCNSIRSHILDIGSQEENDFVMTLSPSDNIWLDLRYSSFLDNLVKYNGDVGSYSNWRFKEPLSELSRGECASINTSTGQWSLKRCYSGTQSVVCEMPLVNQ